MVLRSNNAPVDVISTALNEASLPGRMPHAHCFASSIATELSRARKPMKVRKENPNIENASFLSPNEISYAHDLNGNMIFLNAAGERISGYSCDEVRGMNITQLLGAAVAATSPPEISHTTVEVGTVFEMDLIAKDGQRVPLEVSTELVLRDGLPIQINGIAVRSVINEAAPSILQARCLDEDLFFG